LDRRIIEAMLAGLVDRHACIEEEMKPTCPGIPSDARKDIVREDTSAHL